MKTRNVIMIIVVALIFVVATVLTIVGIVTHKEPVFSDDTKSWDRAAFPLLVRGTRYTSTGDAPLEDWQRGALDGAIDMTNDRLGFEAFRDAPSGEGADLIVDLGVPYDDTWEAPGGQFRLMGQDNTYTECHILTSNTATSELLYWTLQHELGHCLGLAHDDFTLSIMYPQQRSVADLRERPWITDDDRAALRERYAPVD